MAWIPNVNPSELIESSWGNTIRDHVVNVFASTAERAAAIPAPTVGMTTYQQDTGRLETWRPPAGTPNGTRLWRPPVGTVLSTGMVGVTDINATVGGLYDVATISQGVTYPFDCLTYANAQLVAGFGGGPVNFRTDLYHFGTGAVTTQFGPLQSVGGAWAAVPVAFVLGNAPNTSVGFKARVYYDAGPNIHTTGTLTIQVVVHI